MSAVVLQVVGLGFVLAAAVFLGYRAAGFLGLYLPRLRRRRDDRPLRPRDLDRLGDRALVPPGHPERIDPNPLDPRLIRLEGALWPHHEWHARLRGRP